VVVVIVGLPASSKTQAHSDPRRESRQVLAHDSGRGTSDIDRVYLELADATPAEAARGMALLQKLVMQGV
jgi:hypothetical protein